MIMISSNFIRIIKFKINLTLLMSQSPIDYKIKNHTKFPHEKGYKQLSKINQKAQTFRFVSESVQFEIQLTFLSPAIINLVQIKARYTNQVVFDFYNEKQRVVVQRIKYSQDQINEGKMKVAKLNQKAQIFTKVIVRFLNYPEEKKTEISYILFRGFKQQQPKKPNKVKNVSESDTFEPGTKRKVNNEDRDMFNARNKEKNTKATSPGDLIQEVVKQKRDQRKKTQKEHQQQLKRVLQISKKQFEKSEKKKNNQYKEEIVIQDDEKNQYNQQIENEFFEYQVVEFDKIKKVFEHVTPQWIEAQRKAEQRRNIQARHSLAAKIKIKVFPKLDFCLNNIYGTQKNKLIKLIQQLGGRSIDEPKNDCIIVTNKMQGGKINLGLTMQRVKFVKPEYIEECDKMKAKLDEKDFIPKS